MLKFPNNDNLSEEEGFEPPVDLRQLLFSKQMHSATLPLFHGGELVKIAKECSISAFLHQ